MRSFPGLAVLLLACAPALRAQAPAAGAPTFQGFVFGDLTYVATERDAPEGFVVGQLVGHGSATLSQRVSFFGEVTATARPTGYGFEVERVILRYELADALKASVGRYHTPISYWNTAYHHGAWLQASVKRPEMIRIGGTFLPVHFVGLLVEGSLPASSVGLAYQAGLGNGRAEAIGRAGDAGDVNDGRAVVAGLQLRPPSLSGLQVGVAGYLDEVGTEGSDLDEQIVTAHGVWSGGALEVIAEWARVAHEGPLVGDEDAASQAWSLHVGYRLPGGLAALVPYARYEDLDVDPGDPVFSGLSDYDGFLVGLRWDFDVLAAIKAELRRDAFADEEDRTSLFLQVSFAVPGGGA